MSLVANSIVSIIEERGDEVVETHFLDSIFSQSHSPGKGPVAC